MKIDGLEVRLNMIIQRNTSKSYIYLYFIENAKKQLKMLLGWAAIHQEELHENWYLARQRQELFTIEPLR